MIAREGVEVLSRHIDACAADDTLEHLVRNVVTQLDVGNLPVSGVLDLAIREEVVPSQRGIVGIVGARNAGEVGQSVLRPAVGIEQADGLVRRSVAGVQVVVDTVRHVVVQCAEGRDAQVEAFVLEASAQTEADLGQTAAEHHLVVGIDDAVGRAVRTTHVLVEAVTHVGTVLCGVVVEVGLRAGDAFVHPSVELTNFLAHFRLVGAGDVALGAEAQRRHLVFQGAEVGRDVVLQRVVVIAIGSRELQTAVLHLGCVHRHRGVGHTGVGRHGHVVEQFGRDVLVPLSGELQAVVEHGQVETHVHGLLLLPGDVLVDEGRDGRTRHSLVAERVGHIVAVHGSLIGIFADVLVTELTIAGAQLEHVDHVGANGEELLLVQTPTY